MEENKKGKKGEKGKIANEKKNVEKNIRKRIEIKPT